MSELGARRTTVRLVAAAILMFGFGYALIPLYNVICDITGLNGKSSGLTESVVEAEGSQTLSAMQVDESRWVTVEFVGTANSELPWEFHPLLAEVDVHPGKVTEIYYHARNLTDREITGQAVPSVVPGRAARHFEKIECFCFTEQTLQPGEAKAMLVQFRVNPKIDPSIDRVSLSYTFYALDKDGAVKRPDGKPMKMDHSQHGSAADA